MLPNILNGTATHMLSHRVVEAVPYQHVVNNSSELIYLLGIVDEENFTNVSPVKFQDAQ